MIIEAHGQFQEILKSDVETHEEYIYIEIAFNEDENKYYEIEKQINIILEKLKDIEEEYKAIEKKKSRLENFDDVIRERKELLSEIDFIYDTIERYKKKEKHTRFEEEQYIKAKKDINEVEADLHYLDEEIAELKKFEYDEDLVINLKREANKLIEKHNRLGEEKLALIKKIQKQENKIQTIEYMLKTLKAKGGYEIVKNQRKTSRDYFKLHRTYNMKDKEVRTYEQEFYDLDEFLQKFGISMMELKEGRIKEQKLKKLRIQKRKKKSGVNNLVSKISKRKGARRKRRLNFEKEGMREDIVSKAKELTAKRNELLKKIEEDIQKDTKNMTESERVDYLKKLKEQVEEERLKRDNPIAYELKQENKRLAKQAEEFKKELEEMEKKEEEFKIIRQRRAEERKKIEDEYKKIKQAQREQEALKEQETEKEESVIDKISKPIKKVFNKIFSIFK